MLPCATCWFAALFTGLASPVFADLAKIESEADFVQLISGKTLTRPLVELRVSQSGGISGMGAIWAVTGQWTWENGYFCRSLEWGGDDLGYNCQEVTARDGRIRFTSDKGTGDSAAFTLR